MELISNVAICRHAVKTVQSGLSIFQEQLINHESLIRIAEAPAGSGKSYAFLLEVLLGKRVLFVVPTRRLAANLIASLQDDMKKRGWKDDLIKKKISLWSSDERERLQAIGVKNVTQRRLFEISELSPMEGGEIVVTTPESLAWLVLDPSRFPVQAASDRSVLDVIYDFDHIVFDEMHTIEKRGLSLSLILTWLCVQMPEKKTYLSYLSATPVDLTQPFTHFGLKREDIAYLSENIIDLDETSSTDELRVIHGDVKVFNYKNTSLDTLLLANAKKALKEIRAGRQVILIYDELYNGLSKALPDLAIVLKKIGLNTSQALLISSVDDSQKGDCEYLGFSMGAEHDPKDFPILIATSSIEIGVTFQCRLLFMQPGHNAASMVQRIGRVSRGDYDGEIHIAIENHNISRNIWLKQFLSWAEKNSNKKVSINELTSTLCKSLKIHPVTNNIFQKNTYGSMPVQAAYIAGFYWNLMTNHIGLKGTRSKLLQYKHPKLSIKANKLLEPIKQIKNDFIYADAAQRWLDLFEAEIKKLRTIPKSIVVKSIGTNKKWTIPIKALQKNTNLLDLYKITENEYGTSELLIDEAHWRDSLLNEQRTVNQIQNFCLPHTLSTFPFKFDAKPEFLKILRKEIDQFHPDSVRDALESLKKITEQTGLICVIE